MVEFFKKKKRGIDFSGQHFEIWPYSQGYCNVGAGMSAVAAGIPDFRTPGSGL
jgi:hypothetical protein